MTDKTCCLLNRIVAPGTVSVQRGARAAPPWSVRSRGCTFVTLHTAVFTVADTACISVPSGFQTVAFFHPCGVVASGLCVLVALDTGDSVCVAFKALLKIHFALFAVSGHPRHVMALRLAGIHSKGAQSKKHYCEGCDKFDFHVYLSLKRQIDPQ